MITKRGNVYYVVIRYKTSNEVWKKKWIRAGASRRDALRLERKYMQDRDAGVPLLDRNTASTMREFFDQWMDASVKPPSRSAGTYENYQYCAEKLCAADTGGGARRGKRCEVREAAWQTRRYW